MVIKPKERKPLESEEDAESVVDLHEQVKDRRVYPDVPGRYLLNDRGLRVSSEGQGKKWDVISSTPFWLNARISNTQGTEWFFLVGYVDHDGNEKEVVVPADELVDEKGAVCRRFARLGIGVFPRTGPAIYVYLNSFENVDRQFCVDRIGWIKNQFAFILPDRVIGETVGEEKYVLREHEGAFRSTYASRGRHEDWVKQVADVSEIEPLFLFSLIAGFTSCLLELIGMDGGGFMFAGSSSKGKSTALGNNASTWGCGADPASTSESSVERMNATANGMEGIARLHSSMTMALDELGSYQGKNFGSLVYDLAGGSSKSVMNSSRELVQRGGWILVFVASGELTIKEKLIRNKEAVNAGMTVRFLDIQIDQIESDNDLPQEEMRVLVEGLKDACATHYGTAGPMFVEKLIQAYSSREEAKQDLLQRLDAITQQLVAEGMGTEQVRSVKRFALVALAGILASEFGVINTAPEKIMKATTAMLNAWVVEKETISDGERAIASMSGYLFRNQHRFLDLSDDTIQGNQAGYTKDDMFLLTDHAFIQGIGEINANVAKKALLEAGYLHVQGKSTKDIRYKSRYKIPGANVRRPFYCINMDILSVDGTS